MVVYRFPLGPLSANCYLVVCERTKKGIIVDPADEGDFISEKILQLKITPLFIFATHGHFDHIMAAEELRLNFNIPFLVHKEDEFLLRTAKERGDFWLGKRVWLPPKKWEYIKEGDKIRFGKETLEVIHTPGHTPGSICLYNKKENILFSGDLIFKDGVGRTDFSYSSSEKMESSLKKIGSLPKDTLVYPGHGKEFCLGEKLGNLSSASFKTSF